MIHEIIVEIQDEDLHKYGLEGCREVVRCKDCVCWDTSWKPTRAIEGAYWCSNNDIYTESDDYCSLGERKES